MTAPQIAGINRRFGAYLLDGVFVGLIQAIAGGLILAPIATYDPRIDGALAFVQQSAIGIAYFVITWTQNGASPGQQLLGVRTLAYEDGSFLSQRQALTRWAFLYGPGALAPLVGAFTAGSTAGFFYIGLLVYLVVLYRTTLQDQVRRGLHDRWSGSVVMGPGYARGGTTAAPENTP